MLKKNLEIPEDLMRKQTITRLKQKEKLEPREVLWIAENMNFYVDRSMVKNIKQSPDSP